MSRRGVALVLAASLAAGAGAVAGFLGPQRPRGRPIIFLHGVSASAADQGVPGGQFDGLLSRLAVEYPRPSVCQAAAQPGRPWPGSPCVFRYVDDLATGGDSQSGVQENAAKLAAEVHEVFQDAGGQRVVLIGYSMGGAIVRAFLGLHRGQAEREVAGVVLIDAATEGSWGFVLDLRSKIEDPAARGIADAVARVAGALTDVDVDRPAYTDLQPGSELYRKLASMPVPRTVDTYTFWGDILIAVPVLPFPSPTPALQLHAGDLLLLPGDPDPSALPELGGQRYTPTDLAPGAEALDVPHSRVLTLDPGEVLKLLGACLSASATCRNDARRILNPDAHSQVPTRLDEARVDHPTLGGRVSLEDAIVAAVGRAGS